MATQFALPSQAFSDVQRFLKQKRATGQTVSPRETRYAWQGYFDALSARRAQSQGIGMQARSLDLKEEEMRTRFALDEERMKREEGAAKVAGVSQLVSTGAISAYALKGTKVGAAIGLGAPAAGPTPTPIAETLPGVTAASAAAPWTAAGVEAGKFTAAGAAGAGTGTYGAAGAATASALETAASAPLASVGGIPGVGAAVAAGFLGSEIGEYVAGNDAGEIIGGATGGAAIGFAFGQAPGAIIGGLIGGAIGVVKAIKD